MNEPEPVRRLANDTYRLLLAGAATAMADTGLQRGAGELRSLTARVPALAVLADAVEQLLAASAADAARRYLSLLVLLRTVRAALAKAAMEGDAAPLEPSGPWSTDSPVAEVLSHVAMLLEWHDKSWAVARVDGERRTGDLRLVGPLLSPAVAVSLPSMGRELLTRFGSALVPELRRMLDVEAPGAAAGLLTVLCQLEPTGALALCRNALRHGSHEIRAAVLAAAAAMAPDEAGLLVRELLPVAPDALRYFSHSDWAKTNPTAAEDLALEMLRNPDRPRRLRPEAVECLCRSSRDETLEVLFGIYLDPNEDSSRDHGLQFALEKTLPFLPHPGLGQRLLRELRECVADFEDWSHSLPFEWGQRQQALELLNEADRMRAERRSMRLWRIVGLLLRRGQAEELGDVLRLLTHSQPALRRSVAAQLHQLGDRMPSAVAGILDGLARADDDTRTYLIDAVGRCGRAAVDATPFLLQCLRHRTADVRHYALGAFVGVAPPNPEVVAVLTPLLRNRANTTRLIAATALGAIGPFAAPAVPDLIAQFGVERKKDVRPALALALGRIGEPPTEVLAALRTALEDRASEVRTAAVEGMGHFARRHSAGLDLLLEALGHRFPGVRAAAATALGQLAMPPDAVVSRLAVALSDKDAKVREATVYALGNLGPAALSAVPALLAVLLEKSTTQSWDVLRALEKLGELPASSAPTLILLLRQAAHSSTRSAAAATLVKIHGANAEVTAALIAALRTDGEALVRSAAADALGRFGAVETIPTLLEALRDPHRFTRAGAARALGQFGPAAAAAVPALEQALHDVDVDLRKTAAVALQLIRPGSGP